MPDSPTLVTHRARRAPAAVVFVHGFAGDPVGTWGRFPELLADAPALASWDVFSVGYATSLSFDVAGVWSADPGLVTAGGLLTTISEVPPLDGYQAIALLAHSMGGLLVQRALLVWPGLRTRVSHVLLFGTPSAGLRNASPFAFWKRQVRDLADDGPFIATLRQQWAADITAAPPFQLLAVAGDRDEFVPSSSSLDPFPVSAQRVIDGNHLDIVKPTDANHLGLKLAVKALTGDRAVDAIDTAHLAVESRSFQQAIDSLWPIRAELDDRGLVSLALALDSVGRRADAIALLRESPKAGTDPQGVLAGRLKRRWLAEHRRADGDEALHLYRDALDRSLGRTGQAPSASQAFYHAINCAFMELAHCTDVTAARAHARQALDACETSGADDVWRHATEGEAHIYLGDPDQAIVAYGRALAKARQPWMLASIYQQAVRAADLSGDDALAARLTPLFQTTP